MRSLHPLPGSAWAEDMLLFFIRFRLPLRDINIVLDHKPVDQYSPIDRKEMCLIQDALKKAEELELDLVEISPNADPPVCKIVDYQKLVIVK